MLRLCPYFATNRKRRMDSIHEAMTHADHYQDDRNDKDGGIEDDHSPAQPFVEQHEVHDRRQRVSDHEC